MYDEFDSRALRRTDCFGQRFMKAGTYRYGVFPANGQHLSLERPFAIKVDEARPGQRMKQHTVTLSVVKGGFKPDKPEITIEAGDMVVWNCPEKAMTPYAVVGDKEFFASSRLVNECGYSHAFGLPGDYHWVDAFGGPVQGVVRVRDPGVKTKDDLEKWRQTLAQGTVVMIDDQQAKPREIEIFVGQTVFFAVTKSAGLSITDERLLETRK
jgi:plastocyanin